MAFVCKNDEWVLRTKEQDWSLAEFSKRLNRPAYVYDFDEVRERAKRFSTGPAQVHYAMKANAHPRLLSLLKSLGLGVDVVSLGEMNKALAHGFAPQKIIFSGVGKDREDLAAALRQGILQINAESFEELQALASLAREMKMTARVALRLNIHLSAPTHKNIQTATEESKFGLDIRLLPEVLQWLKSHSEVQLVGLAVHIGSQILDVGVFETMSRKIGEVYKQVKSEGLPLQRLDLGGGLGIRYEDDGSSEDFERLDTYFSALSQHGTDAAIVCEPGRFLVARSGVLLSKVVYIKRGLTKKFAILNAGMTCLMRPALYEAYHRIEPLKRRTTETESYSVVGPICESTDVFAEERSLPRLEAGDWVGIFEAGAYGAVMASGYNETPLPEQWSLLDGKWEVL